MSGLDVDTKMSVTKSLMPYAASEARLKHTSLAESLETFVGLGHMTGIYEPAALQDLARKFSFISLATNSSLPQFEKTLSYSMPRLRTGMGMDPEDVRQQLSGRRDHEVGLVNVDERLRQVFGADHGITVETALGAGTKVTVRIPKYHAGVRAS